MWMGLMECDQRCSGLEETLNFISESWARPSENVRGHSRVKSGSDAEAGPEMGRTYGVFPG